jgi:hypothetical protein
MILIRQQATQIYQFALAVSLGLGITLIDHQCVTSPLLRSYVALCYAPNGPVHPTSASLYSGCSLAFSFSLTARQQFCLFVCGLRHTVPQSSRWALGTDQTSPGRGPPEHDPRPVPLACQAHAITFYRCRTDRHDRVAPGPMFSGTDSQLRQIKTEVCLTGQGHIQ